MVETEKELTPLMRQYFDIKNKFTDGLLFFQVGDFYELFFDDAKVASSFLGIALTKRGTCRGQPVPLCGVPLHALDHYLGKLIKGGFKVALCDQLEPPKPGTVVKRGVTQVLTPGTLTDAKLLDDKSPSYLFSFFPMEQKWGLLFGELLTARLFGTIVSSDADKILDSELSRFVPDEVVLPLQAHGFKSYFTNHGYCTSIVEYDVQDQAEKAAMDAWMLSQFKPEVSSQLSLTEYQSLRSALYYFYAYVRRNQESALSQFRSLQFYEPDDFMLLDATTQRTIELVRNSKDGSRANTLFSVVDRAQTAMGSRTIKKWLVTPLIDRQALAQRHDAVEVLVNDPELQQRLVLLLSSIGDLERLVGRIALGRGLVHDYIALRAVIDILPQLRSLLLEKDRAQLLALIGLQIEDFNELTKLLKSAINDDPSTSMIIKSGFDDNLDRLRDLTNHAQEKLLALEIQEQQKTGIPTLKIRYNQVFGYSFEITKSQLALVPSYFVRQQTLAGKERFTTSELQQLEHDLVYAQNAIETVEREIFACVKAQVAKYIHSLRMVSYALSRLDALLGLAVAAYENGYVRPTFHECHDIIIEQGRHPVVEQMLKNRFIPNDVKLTHEESLWIITGPNMGGKSTFLRQVALICVLGQAGSFVPAKSAKLPLLDRIFTRIGAGDNLAEGKSTFLVEMEETALICTQATQNSLVILDEVGRGTSTFDGLAIAQSVVEYLAQIVSARCLFATHYHELTLLKERIAGIASYYMASSKSEQGLLFLYAIKRGVADGSFGVEVAKLAALPPSIIERALEILERLTIAEAVASGVKEMQQVQSYCQEQTQQQEILRGQLKKYEEALDGIKNIDLDDLSPKKAFDLIWQMKHKLR